MTVSYSCAHSGLPYLALQWPLSLIAPCCPLLLASATVSGGARVWRYSSPVSSQIPIKLKGLHCGVAENKTVTFLRHYAKYLANTNENSQNISMYYPPLKK